MDVPIVSAFESYLDQAWTDHAPTPAKVESEFHQGLQLAQTNDDLEQLGLLTHHVMGTHLGKWERGVQLLKSYEDHLAFQKGGPSHEKFNRWKTSLEIASGKKVDLSPFSLSDQIQILAQVTAAIADKDAEKALQTLRKALLMAVGISPSDSANRALAASSNNLASTLEDKNPRSDQENELMVFAAHTARKYWEIAGTWQQVASAEYRLAMTYIQTKDFAQALKHAELCLHQRQENQADDNNLFFAYEALALVEKNRKNEAGFQKALEQAQKYFEKLNAQQKQYAEPSLKALG